MEWITGLDGQILLYLQDMRYTPLNPVMNFITFLGENGIVPILTCVLLLLIKKYRYTGITASLSLLMEFIAVNIVIKPAVHRIRPYMVVQGLECITRLAHDYSFPSGHTGSCFAVATVIWLKMPHRYGIPAVIAATLVGFSRLYLGVHFPTDVLAGMLIGIVTGIIAVKSMKLVSYRN